jgi:DNA polymerase-3 subunit beta
MKFTIERSQLLKSLGHVQSVVEKRNTIPVLSNVLLEADNGQLTLKATDMDLEITETLEAEIGEAGITTAPAHMLYDIARKLPDGAQVDLVYPDENGHLSISAGRSKFSLACIDADDFPAMSEDALPCNFSISPADLKSMIDRTKFAVSTEETRYYLNGIYMHAHSSEGVDVLRAAATDGHRLARVEIPLPAGAKVMSGVIIPRKTIGEIRKLIEEVEGEISISVSETKIKFSFDGVILTSKLIDGTYPDYERVVPSDNDKLLEIDVLEFKAAVDRVSVVSERSRGVKAALTAGKVTISASVPEAGSGVEEVEASYEAEDLEVGFNFRYLLDILQEIKGDTVQFSMKDGASPTVVQDIADKSALYVLMPMRV